MQRSVLRAALIAVVLFLFFITILSGCGKDTVTIDLPEDVPSEAVAAVPEQPEQMEPEEQPEDFSLGVTASLSDAGSLKVGLEPLTVTDADDDGVITVYDAIWCLHEAYYPGGAAKGFATERMQEGPAISLFWGEDNGGFYSWTVDGRMGKNLLEPLAEGSELYAFSYSDLPLCLDGFGSIHGNTVTKENGERGYEGVLTCTDVTGEEFPVAGAMILIDGIARGGIVTDDQGKFFVPLKESGSYLLTAVSADIPMIPPVCRFDFTVG